jgi:hypothetical protein
MKNKLQEDCDKKEQIGKAAMEWFKAQKLNSNEVLLTSDSPITEFDYWLNSGSTECIVEVKVRRDATAAQMKKWGGPFFEAKKFFGICEYKEKFAHNSEVLYFNFLKDELQIFKIRKDPTYYSWYLKKLPKNNTDLTLVWKHVVNLQEEELIETIKYK